MALDRQYGRNPDLEAMPKYCVPFSHKNWYDAKDMRSTGGNDVAYAMDAPPKDSPDIADLRAKGAAEPKTWMPDGSYAYAAWGGHACNPYDTERVARGTSSGSGVSVGANLVMCSICEQGSASCKGPGSRNNVVNLLTTRGPMMHGGMNSQRVGDRAGIHCRTVEDTAKVLDAVKGFNSEDMFTAIPAALISKEPFASVIVKDPDSKPLKGVRVGIVREFMVKHSKNDVAISDQLDAEMKAVLRDKLGAEPVESVDPLYPDGPGVPNMSYTFQDAFREILAHNVPEYFWQRDSRGELEFAVPGWDVRTVDYAIALALGKAPLSDRLNLRRISSNMDNLKSPFTVNKYPQDRGDTKVFDWASRVANAKWDNEEHRVASENAVGWQDMRPGEGAISYLKLQKALQLVVQKVIYENDIDVFVNPENTLPPPKIDVPAGYTTTAVEPRYELSADRKTYVSVPGEVATPLPNPMPLSMMFWAGPGTDATVIRTGSAYEAATHYRKPPPAFGPVPGEPR
jgi:amidase